MTRDEFRRFFEHALEVAAQNIEKEYSVTVPRSFQIELYGMGHSGDLLDVESALDVIYLGEERYFFLIDVAVLWANPTVTTVFIAISGYPPKEKIEDTWNQPPGSGPFKQIISLQFKYQSE